MAVIEYMNVILGMNHQGFDKSVDAAANKIRKVNQVFQGSFFGSMGGSLAAGGIAKLSGALIGFGGDAIRLAADAETAAISFEVLTGSADKASQLISNMRKLDQSSPLNFEDFQQAGKTMLGFGLSADEATKRMEQLSAISLGNSDRFSQLSLAFSQTTAAGRLMGQEVLQFVNAGFNPLQQISQMTGESMAELKARMEAGGISVEEVGRAFDRATGKGGLFFGMNEKLADSTSGQLAKLQGDFTAIARGIGEGIAPALRESVDLIRQFSAPGSQMASFFTKAAEQAGDTFRFYKGLVELAATGDFGSLERLINDVDTRNAIEKANSFKHKPTADEQARIDKRMAEIQKQKDLEKQFEDQRKKEDEAYQKRLDKQTENLNGLRQQLELEEKTLLTKDEQLRQQAASLAYYGKERQEAYQMLKQMEKIKQLKQDQEDLAQMTKDMSGSLLTADIEKAAGLLQRGFLSGSQFDSILGREASRIAEGRVVERRDSPTAMAGSVEAYKLFIERDQHQAKQTEIAMRSQEALTDIRAELKSRQLLGVAKR